MEKGPPSRRPRGDTVFNPIGGCLRPVPPARMLTINHTINGNNLYTVITILTNTAIYVCMYVYCTYYAPICYANGMEKASFARIVGADYYNI